MAMSFQVVVYQYQPFCLEWPCRSKSFYTNTNRLVQNRHAAPSRFIPIPTAMFRMAMSFQVVLYQYQPFSLEWPCRSKSFYTNTNRLVQNNGHVGPSRFLPIPTIQFRMAMSFQVVLYQYQTFSLEWPCRSKSFYTNTNRLIQNGHVVQSHFIWSCRSKSFYTNANHLVYNGHVVPSRFIPIPTVQFRMAMSVQVVFYQSFSLEWPCSKSFYTNTKRLVQNMSFQWPTAQLRMAMSFQVVSYQYQPLSLEWSCRSKSFFTNTNHLVQNGHVVPSQLVLYQYQPFSLEQSCRSKSFYTNTNRLIQNGHVVPNRFIPIPTAQFRMVMSFQVVFYQYQPCSLEWPCCSKSFFTNTNHLVQNGHVVPSRFIPIPTVQFRMAMSFYTNPSRFLPIPTIQFRMAMSCRSKSFYTNTKRLVQNGHVVPSRFIPIPTAQFRIVMSFHVVLYQYQPFSLEWPCRSKSFYTNTNRLVQNGHVVPSRFLPIPTIQFRMAMSFQVVLYQYQPFSLEWPCRSKSFYTNTNRLVQNSHVAPSRFLPIPTICYVQNGHVVPSRFIPIPTVQFRMAMSFQLVLYQYQPLSFVFYQYQPFSLEWPCRSKSFYTNTKRLVQNGHVVPKSFYTNTNRLVQNGHVVPSRFIPIPTVQFRMAMSFQVVLYQYQPLSLEWPCRSKSFHTNTNRLVQNGHVVPSRFLPIPTIQFRMAMSFQVVLYQYQTFSLEWPCRSKSFYTNTNRLVQNGHVIPRRFIPIPTV